MVFAEIFRLAFSSLAANKLRSALTLLGIAVGVFSVIGVMTFINGLRDSIETGLNVLGANSFQINKWPAISFSPNDWMKYRNRRDVTYPIASRFKDLMADTARVNLQLGRGGKVVVYKERKTNPNIGLRGTDENFITAFNFEVKEGRNLSVEDVEYARPVCLLGADVIAKVFPDGGNALGEMIRIDGQNYTVVGVLAPKGASFGGSADNFVATPITRFLSIYGRQFRSISINVQATNQAALPDTQDHAIGAMRLVRGLHPEDPDDFEIFSNESLIESFNKVLNVVAAGAFIISAIALLASGVGVMNIMLVSVTERTKEIGIRKSIGAKKTNILTQFLVEAVTLSLVGGLAGVLAGVLGGNIGAYFMHVGINFPWFWAGMGMFVCGGIGITFGLYPAWKAASLDPIEALRYE